MKPFKHEAPMSNDARIAVLETTIHHIDVSLNSIATQIERLTDRMDKRFDAMDKKIHMMDLKFDNKIDALDKKFDAKFDLLYGRLWTGFLWLLSMIIGLAGLVAHALHWI